MDVSQQLSEVQLQDLAGELQDRRNSALDTEFQEQAKVVSSRTRPTNITTDILFSPVGSPVEDSQEVARRQGTGLEFLAALDMYSAAARPRLSGIVCTIGPSSAHPDTLLALLEAGMTVARCNFSHGTHDYHAMTIANCRIASGLYKAKHGAEANLAIALDTKGPEIRTGRLEGDTGRKEVLLKAGDSIKLTTDPAFRAACTAEVLWLDYASITKVMVIGKRLFIDDGLISVRCTKIGEDYFEGVIENDGSLGSEKGCNLPGTDTDLPAVSEKDRKDLQFGVEQGVDMVFASFIRNAEGVKEIRKVLGEKGKDIWIIPKIENQQGIKNLTEIIAASEGMMVARGDMGIEIPREKVFIAQKAMIAQCNLAGKAVICATQLLESMVTKPRPTRAEASDVANAVMDGADCVMLSGETAKGDFPVACVDTMSRLAREAESCVWNERVFEDLLASELRKEGGQAIDVTDVTSTAAVSAVLAAARCKAAAVVVLTTCGATAMRVAKYRPQCPVIAVTRFGQLARQLRIYRGVRPLLHQAAELDDWVADVDARVQAAIAHGKHEGFVGEGDRVVVVTGWRRGAGNSNTVRVVVV